MSLRGGKQKNQAYAAISYQGGLLRSPAAPSQ